MYTTIAPAITRLHSITRRVRPMDLLAFLRGYTGGSRVYWAHGSTAFAGYGAAAYLTASGEDRFACIAADSARLFAHLEHDPAFPPPRLFGGFSFQPDFVADDVWAGFAPAAFVLPRVMLSRIDGETYLTLNAYAPSAASLEADLDLLCEALRDLPPLPDAAPPPRMSAIRCRQKHGTPKSKTPPAVCAWVNCIKWCFPAPVT